MPFRVAQSAFIEKVAECKAYLDDFLENPENPILFRATSQRVENLKRFRQMHEDRYRFLADMGEIVCMNEAGKVRRRITAELLNLVAFNPARIYFDVCSSCYGRVERYDPSFLDLKIKEFEGHAAVREIIGANDPYFADKHGDFSGK